METSYFM